MEREDYRYEHVEYRISPHAHFRVFRNDAGYVSLHWHDALELIWVQDGELAVIVNRQETIYRAGDIALINMNVLHATASPQGNSAVMLQIPSKDLLHYIPEMREKMIVWDAHSSHTETQKKMAAIRDLMAELQRTAETQPPGYILHFESCILEMIYQLYSGFGRGIDRIEGQISASKRERMSQIISYTEQHYTEPITLEEIADKLHLQVNYFCRFFKAITGQTYLNYLRDYRLYKIYHDVVTTDLPIAAIAERHGFTNEKLLRQSFRARFRGSPTEIRRAGC